MTDNRPRIFPPAYRPSFNETPRTPNQGELPRALLEPVDYALPSPYCVDCPDHAACHGICARSNLRAGDVLGRFK